MQFVTALTAAIHNDMHVLHYCNVYGTLDGDCTAIYSRQSCLPECDNTPETYGCWGQLQGVGQNQGLGVPEGASRGESNPLVPLASDAVVCLVPVPKARQQH